jgi:thiol:disulfide interchange protein DsbD
MRILKFWLFGLLLASPGAFALSGSGVATANVKARLVSEASAIGPGQSIWVALELNIRDGWHTYWRNPGDSGQATTLKWQLPPGFTGRHRRTAPHRFEIPPLVNYGYAKHAVHLVQITAPTDLKAGTPVTLSAKAGWLVCSDVCIPEDAALQLKLPASAEAGAVDSTDAALFTAARGELPRNWPRRRRASRAADSSSLGRGMGATLAQIKSPNSSL